MHTPAMKKRPQPLPAHAVSEAEGLVRTRQPQPASAGRDLASLQEWVETLNKTLPTSCTLLALVQGVHSHTTSDVETVAVVLHLINSGRVRLRGTFAGAKISFLPTRVRRNRYRAPDHLSKGNQYE
jgi:hypothetical protein